MDLPDTVLIDKARLASVVRELSAVTAGPGEAAAACLVLFIQLWDLAQPELTLAEIADAARTMILSYEIERSGELMQ
jgi:hypothetical protein